MTRDEFLMEVSALLAEHLPLRGTIETVKLAVAITDHAERHACCFVHALPVARAKIKAEGERGEWFNTIEAVNATDKARDAFKAHVVSLIEFELRANQQPVDPPTVANMAESVMSYCEAMGLPLVPASVQSFSFEGRDWTKNATKH